MFSPGTPFADRYRMDAEVGRGTFGIVYRAFDFVEQCEVAVKVLNDEANSDAKLKQRLRREARLTTEMKNRHCVKVLDVAEAADGRAYIVMELLHGRELRVDLEQKQPLPVERTIDILRQVLDAVAAAHDLGVVHRDLKPSNIFLCTDGTVKVLDFGIAKVTGNADGTGLSESARLTTHGHILGTPVYMSPEQARGEVPTTATDLYAVGVMAFEMTTGRPPFDDPNPVRVMLMHNTEKLPSLPPALTTQPLGAAVLRALEKDPERRFPSAREFSKALTEMLAPLPPAADPASKSPPTAAASKPSVRYPSLSTGVFVTEPTDPPQSDPPPAPARSRGMLFAAILAVVVVGLAVAAWLALG